MSLSAVFALAAAAGAPTTADFTVGGLAFRATIPAGYCLPEGEQVQVQARVAASDPANITDLTLIECGVRAPALPELIVLKTLRAFERTPLERQSFIVQMAAALPAVTQPAEQQKLLDQAEDNIAGATGAKVDLKGTLRGQGSDNVCAYIGGSVDVAAADRKATGLVGGCATVVGSRQFTIYRVSYKPRSDGGAGLLAEARALALKIEPLAGN